MDGGGDKGNEADDDHLRDFLKNLQLTKNWLRRRYGDRILGMMGFDDFLQEAAITIWKNRSDPKFMLRKAKFQQKTFFAKKHYKNRSVPISTLELDGASPGKSMSDLVFVEKTSKGPLVVLDEDWEVLRIRHNLRDTDITMLRMKCEGKTTHEISLAVGIAVNSVHVRISNIKHKIVTEKKESDNP